jgi:hypothetical protein
MDDSDDDYYPMWTKVLDPNKEEGTATLTRPCGAYYYYNNFDASIEWDTPDDYNAVRDKNFTLEIQKLPYSSMPRSMSRLVASIRIQSMARAHKGRKRVRAVKGDKLFESMTEEKRTLTRETTAGWLQLIDFGNVVVGQHYMYWYHPGTMVEAWDKPTAATEAEILAAQKKKVQAQKARRREHSERMSRGFEEQNAKVDAKQKRREFKKQQRDVRAEQHKTKMDQLHDDLHSKHNDEIIQKEEKKEKQATISAERAVEHQAKMNEDLQRMTAKQQEHDTLIHDLERRADLVLERGSGPWKLHIGVKSATGLRAADWALRGGGKSDPYVRVLLNGKDVGKTKSISKTLDPVWDANINVHIATIAELGAESWEDSELLLKVYDYDVVGSDDLLGQLSFAGVELLRLLGLTKDDEGNMNEEQRRKSMNESQNELGYSEHPLNDPEGMKVKKKEQAKGSLTLAADLRVVLKKRHVLDAKKGAKKGKKQSQKDKKKNAKDHESHMEDLQQQEHIKAQYHAEAGVQIAEHMLPLDQNAVKEWVLEATFLSATGLKKADRWGKSDPYVQVYVNGISLGSSSILKKTLNPEWNQTKDLLVRRKKHMKGKGKTSWRESVVIFEVYDHDLVGMDDPLGRIVLEGQELLGMITAQERGQEEEETMDRQLYERNGKKAKGTLRVRAALKPAKTEDIEAVNREIERLAALEAKKVAATWTVWLRLYDNVAHAEYFAHSETGRTLYDLPIPKGSTKEKEQTRHARVLPEELAKGPPIHYRQHIAARLIGQMARRRKARTRVLRRRGEVTKLKNGGGQLQVWVKAFHPFASRNYFWNSTNNIIVWDTPPEEMQQMMKAYIRSYDGAAGMYYYHRPPFDKDSWTWNLPKEFTPGGHAQVVDAATIVQGMYRSFFSRMGRTRNGERKNMFSFSKFAETPKAKRKMKMAQQKQQKLKMTSENSTADERAEKALNRSIERLEDVIESFELPYRHRRSSRTDRRKVLNHAHDVMVAAVAMSISAGNRIAASKGMAMTQQLAKPSTQGDGKRTTQQIMDDEVTAFSKRVSEASDAVQGAAAITAWYEVETVYRLKRLLAGLTAMDIYQLSAPAHEDVGAAHEKLKLSIHDSEHVVSEILSKLGKGFRKSLRRWGKMMNEDCGKYLANVSTSDLLPVDRTLEGAHDPLRYGRYYWMTVKRERMMPFPVDLGGISYKRMKKFIANMSKAVYTALKHAKIYLMLVGDERDSRIGREEVCSIVLVTNRSDVLIACFSYTLDIITVQLLDFALLTFFSDYFFPLSPHNHTTTAPTNA